MALQTGLVITLLALLALPAAVSCAGSGRVESKSDVAVILHAQRRELRTDADTAALVQEILRSLQTCDGIYELVVTKETIEQLRARERCVEIVFPSPRKVLAGGREALEIQRVLVPLTGRFAEGEQVTMFCGFPEYSAGPYLNSQALPAIVREVDGLPWH